MEAIEPIEYICGEYRISTARDEIELEVVHDFLCNRSYWAKGITPEEVKARVDNSLSFGLFHESRMIGFCRLVTDYTYFGYLADVFVIEEYRGRGLGRLLVEKMLEHPVSKRLSKIMLKTSTAQGLYSKYGFGAACPETDMVRRAADQNG